MIHIIFFFAFIMYLIIGMVIILIASLALLPTLASIPLLFNRLTGRWKLLMLATTPIIYVLSFSSMLYIVSPPEYRYEIFGLVGDMIKRQALGIIEYFIPLSTNYV
jgi:hypothetical protein